jgi:hypothetical protein
MSRQQIIRLERNPSRVYVCDRHLHHGLDGVVLFVVALALMWTDRRDFPWRFAKDSEAYG